MSSNGIPHRARRKRHGSPLKNVTFGFELLMINFRRFNTTPNNRKETRMTSWIMPAVTVLFSLSVFAPQENQLTPKSLQAALVANPRGAEAEKLASRVREYFGKDISDLSKGAAPKIDELTVAWAIEIPDAANAPNTNVAPRVVSAD